MEQITPIQGIRPGIYVKRNDLAYHDNAGARGSKVRQFIAMVNNQPGKPLVVGCSANSAQQVYIADTVRRTGRRGIVVIPARAELTEATRWAIKQGVEVIQVRPGYRSVYMKKAREIAIELGAVRWERDGAVEDTAWQVQNIPNDVKRIVVPVGSGLVAAGVLAGLAINGYTAGIEVFGVAVSTLADENAILAHATKAARGNMLPNYKHWSYPNSYDTPAFAMLPGRGILDPFYAAKAYGLLREGDLLWVTGCRPIDAMPIRIQKALERQTN